MSKTIVHVYGLETNYGIADFIRGSLNLFSFCKKRGYHYSINFTNGIFKDCFELPEHTHLNTEQELHFGQSGYNLNQINESEFENLISNYSSVKVVSNMINLTSEIYLDEFMEFLKPSKLILDFIESLNLPKDYISLHIRVGDHFMNREPNYEIPMDLVTKWNTENKPIVFFTDNQILKERYSGSFIVNNIPIVHTNEESVRNSCNSDVVVKTIAEFYMIGFSQKVLSLKYSGFSHISSYLYKKELTVTFKDSHLEYLNDYLKYQCTDT
jgi:hypothetical protein